MGEPFIGEIRMAGFNFNPKNWALCNGQLLAIAQNQALFSILGTTYGGDGRTTFALPDLRSHIPISFGQGPNLSNYNLGQTGGEESHALIQTEIPTHNHTLGVVNADGTAPNPTGNVFAVSVGRDNIYSTASPDTTMNSGVIANAGSGQGHPNQQPYLVINFIIALNGIFPSRN
jgi:microcystin-dependent protein